MLPKFLPLPLFQCKNFLTSFLFFRDGGNFFKKKYPRTCLPSASFNVIVAKTKNDHINFKNITIIIYDARSSGGFTSSPLPLLF